MMLWPTMSSAKGVSNSCIMQQQYRSHGCFLAVTETAASVKVKDMQVMDISIRLSGTELTMWNGYEGGKGQYVCIK